MAKPQKLELTWIGKDEQPRLGPRILIEDSERSYRQPPPAPSLTKDGIKEWEVANVNQKKHVRLLILSLFILLFIAGCTEKKTPKKVSLLSRTTAPSSDAGEYLEKNTIWFGFNLRLGTKDDVLIYTPFLGYLEKATGKRFRIKLTERYEDTVENLGRGVIHFAALDALSYIIGENKYGIRHLVSGVNKEGDPGFSAVIFVKKDSKIYSIPDLKGRCFAFGSGISTEGHLIPRKMLADEGLTLQDLNKFIYTGSSINVVKSVLNGECDAGGIQDTMARQFESEQRIRILKMSGPYPGSLIAYNSAVDSSIVDSVRAALLAFEPLGKHQGMLHDWDKTEMPFGFTLLDGLDLDKINTLAKEYGLLTK